jgi:mannitol 2-dehydrogenase
MRRNSTDHPACDNVTACFAQVETRRLNPKIADTIARLCQDGSDRQPKYILHL